MGEGRERGKIRPRGLIDGRSIFFSFFRILIGSVIMSVGRLDGQKECHTFLKRQEVTLPYTYLSNCNEQNSYYSCFKKRGCVSVFRFLFLISNFKTFFAHLY